MTTTEPGNYQGGDSQHQWLSAAPAGNRFGTSFWQPCQNLVGLVDDELHCCDLNTAINCQPCRNPMRAVPCANGRLHPAPRSTTALRTISLPVEAYTVLMHGSSFALAPRIDSRFIIITGMWNDGYRLTMTCRTGSSASGALFEGVNVIRKKRAT